MYIGMSFQKSFWNKINICIKVISMYEKYKTFKKNMIHDSNYVKIKYLQKKKSNFF